jgi:tRNA threonylcarbamoyl adenosine modification protein (Sua5/YciO/YrdC/YwlC family)
MKKVLPGPYTFILNANNNVPKLFESKKKTVGIRIPNNNIIREIIKELENPILSKSLPTDGEYIEYATDPDLIYEKYGDLVDVFIDGGYGDHTGSTVLDCTGDDFEVIRQGKGDIDSL